MMSFPSVQFTCCLEADGGLSCWYSYPIQQPFRLDVSSPQCQKMDCGG